MTTQDLGLTGTWGLRDTGTVGGMIWLGALWQVLADVGPAGTAVVVACALLAIVLAVRARRDQTPAPPRPASTARAMRDRIGVPRHRDPDAAGRSRPRAPTAAAAAA